MKKFEAKGAEDFLRASKALKAAGEQELRKELNKALRDAAKPLIADTRAEAERILPKRGGLAKRVAKTPQRVQVRTGQDTAGVRIVVGKSNSGARAANEGTVRHPVFGDRDKFVEQRVPPGWFTRPLEEGAPTVEPFLEQAIDNVLQQIVRSA